ncbi:MAG: DUF4199 domain-containing protein [Alphaproteobacteria bacterium]|nr:DUF4199 domain-containing protein [Alphaproteobacteria bacterium]
MFRKILSYGLVAGLIAGIALSLVVVGVGHELSYGMYIGYAIMLVALSTIFVAVKRRRDAELGGVIGFWQALGMGLGISAVAGVVYVAAWEITQVAAHLDFANSYASSLIAQKKAQGVHGEALAKFVAEMETFKVQYANPLFRWPMTFAEIFPVGVLVSLFSAGALSFSRFLPARRA